MEFLKKHGRTLIFLLIGIVSFIILNEVFTFGFVPLFLILALFLIYPILFPGYSNDGEVRLKTWNYLNSAFIIVIFGCLAFHALNKYINPDRGVFANNDHHALRIDGIEINDQDDFLLAADSPRAFLDNDEFNGELWVRGVKTVPGDTTKCVELELQGFTSPIYYTKGKSIRKHNMIASDMPSFKAGDKVTIVSSVKDESGQPRQVTFQVEENHIGKWKNLFTNLDFHDRDTSIYTFWTNGGAKEVRSIRTVFIKNGMSLSDISAGVVVDMPVEGINIVRSIIWSGIDKDDDHLSSRPKGWKDCYEQLGSRYTFDITNEAQIESIIINGATYPVGGNGRIYIELDKTFYVGFGEHKTTPMAFKRHGDDLTLEWDLPKYQYLSSVDGSKENSVMITTSLFDAARVDGEYKLNPSYTENILLFDVFNKKDNINHIQPCYLSFVSAESVIPMEFTLHTYEKTFKELHSIDDNFKRDSLDYRENKNNPKKYGYYFPGVKAIDNRAELDWLVTVENFKETTPFDSRTIGWVLMVAILCAAAMMLFSSYDKYTSIEYVVYLLLIAFLTIRLFLLWRTSVFVPVSSISASEFEKFRDISLLMHPLGGILPVMIGFFAVIFIFKLALIFKPGLFEGSGGDFLIKCFPRKRSFALAMVAVYILGFIASYVIPERFGNVLLPVMMAVVAEIIISLRFATSYTDDYEWSSYEDPMGVRKDAILMSILNLLSASAFTFVKDAGFGVMFIMFSVFYAVFRFIDLFFHTRRDGITRSMSFACDLLYVCAILFVLFYKRLFITLFNHPVIFFLIIFFAVLLVAYLMLNALNVRIDFKDNEFVKKTCTFAGILAVLCVAGGWLVPKFIEGSHLEYRIRVHMHSNPDEVMLNHISTRQQQSKFLQASLNDWVMKEYDLIGEDVKWFADVNNKSGWDNGYFKMQPQSKVGALWFAQTSDIVLSRYIIAEHSEWLAILFIAAYVILMFVSIRYPSKRRWTKLVIVMIPLLLATQSMMIWLANTGRFIFFGQDFPLISINSKMTTLYFFLLMLILVIIALIEKKGATFESYESDIYSHIEFSNNQTSRLMGWAFVIVLLIFMLTRSAFVIYGALMFVVGLLIRNFMRKDISQQDDDEDNKSAWRDIAKFIGGLLLSICLCFFISKIFEKDKVERGQYNIGELIESVNHDLEPVNNYFADYQIRHKMQYSRDMSSYMPEFMDSLKLNNVFVDDNLGGFTEKLLMNYCNEKSKSNSINDLLYIRNNRSFDHDGTARDVLEFAVNSEYFKVNLPSRIRNAWRGNIVGESTDAASLPKSFTSEGGLKAKYQAVILPDAVTGDGEIIILKAKNGYRIFGCDNVFDINSDKDILCVNEGDKIFDRHKPVPMPIYGDELYAMNVQVNGQRTFVYPRGSEMFWIRDFASQIMNAKNSMKPGEKKQKDFHDDVAVTIDGNLTKEIYSVYKNKVKGGDDRSVVVADGDGFIRAMVDYREDSKYRLNPNDAKEIGKVLDQLELDGEMGTSEEERYFSTFALSPLRCGPGSSQKPIVWTAVTSSYYVPWWKDLKLEALNLKKLSGEHYTIIGNKTYFIMPKYAGTQMERPFKSLAKDEGLYSVKEKGKNLDITKDVDMFMFMQQSSNYYNSLLAYIGSFDSAQLDEMHAEDVDSSRENALFSRPDKGKSYVELFPLLDINGKLVCFSEPLDKEQRMQENSVLSEGLRKNFSLHTYGGWPNEHRDTIRPMIVSLYPSVMKNAVIQHDDGHKTKTIRNVVVPSTSYFNVSLRKDRGSDKQCNEYMVRSVAIGSNSSWNVSPVKMAEMFARTITLNKSYELTLDPTRPTPNYRMFDLAAGWHGMQDYRKSRRQLVDGMQNVFISPGSAKGVKKEKIQEYYVYGKTGTINGLYGGDKKEDHLLAVFITDQDINKCNDLSKVRYYVVYFTDYDTTGWKDINGEILERIVSSEEFRDYMSKGTK